MTVDVIDQQRTQRRYLVVSHRHGYLPWRDSRSVA
jgi:hypothetical protein